MQRRVRYQVAATLDGFIAGPHGEFDWIVMDPAIDFARLYAEFDVALMGRKTYDEFASQENATLPGIEVIAFSRSRLPERRPGVQVTAEDPCHHVRRLKTQPGRDIWLYGGGELFRTLLRAELVDTVEVAVMPVLIGAGVPLMPPGTRTRLTLSDHRVLPGSGIVVLAYAVEGSTAPAPRITFVR